MMSLYASVILAASLTTSPDIVLADESSAIVRDMKALELFLQDKDDHKTFCPKIKWEQPKIAVYKKKLVSQLPKDCKKNK